MDENKPTARGRGVGGILLKFLQDSKRRGVNLQVKKVGTHRRSRQFMWTELKHAPPACRKKWSPLAEGSQLWELHSSLYSGVSWACNCFWPFSLWCGRQGRCRRKLGSEWPVRHSCVLSDMKVILVMKSVPSPSEKIHPCSALMFPVPLLHGVSKMMD